MYPSGKSMSWRLRGGTVMEENILIRDLSLTLTVVSLVLLSSPGTSGISLSHNFYSGSIFKSNSIWTSLSPQRLPPQWLEFTRFYNCGSRVSTTFCLWRRCTHGDTGSLWKHEGGWMLGTLVTWVTLEVAVHRVPPTTTICSFCVSHATDSMFYQVLLCNLKIQLTHWSSAGITWFMLISVCGSDLSWSEY